MTGGVMAVIEVAGLTKRYKGQAVVDGLSFEVAQGEIFGILGPNGAGKTTAVECLAAKLAVYAAAAVLSVMIVAGGG